MGVQKTPEAKHWNDAKTRMLFTTCFRRRTLESVASSRVVSVRVLLTLRLASLLFLVLGGLWITWSSWDRPLCLPDWSYIASTLYFAVGNQLTTLGRRAFYSVRVSSTLVLGAAAVSTG